MAKKNVTRRTAVELLRQADSFTRKDIGAWRRAWQRATNPDTPDRTLLLDIYRDSMVDNHLAGCVAQRFNFVMARSFKMTKPDGSADTDGTEMLNATWFKDFMRYALESRLWGHSLIELGNTVEVRGKMEYDAVRLIPRKHVIPERGVVVKNVGDTWQTGWKYREDPTLVDWYVEAGRNDDLGLLLGASQQCIAKRNILAFWDTFAEVFGMPLRIAKVSCRNPTDREEAEATLRDMGAAGYGVLPTDSEIEVVETAKGDTYNVYDRRIDRCNSEISKLIIGQTMTIEDGSSLSQSETHLAVFENIVESDCDFLRDVINTQLIPRMERHGFPVSGLRFDWDYAVDYTPEQQVAYETMIADRFEVDAKYFAEKYNMPVGKRKDLTEPLNNAMARFFA